MAAFLYEFEWDPVKAKANFSKHGVDFERAAQVFRDPLALTIPDEEHSEREFRWITLGKDVAGRYLLVVHTFEQLTNLNTISQRANAESSIGKMLRCACPSTWTPMCRVTSRN
jgi:uncharacterized DUF497 family protein